MCGRTFVRTASALAMTSLSVLLGSSPRYASAAGMISVGAFSKWTPQSANLETTSGSNTIARDDVGAFSILSLIIPSL